VSAKGLRLPSNARGIVRHQSAILFCEGCIVADCAACFNSPRLTGRTNQNIHEAAVIACPAGRGLESRTRPVMFAFDVNCSAFCLLKNSNVLIPHARSCSAV